MPEDAVTEFFDNCKTCLCPGIHLCRVVVSQYFSGWVILGVFLLILPGLQRKKAVSPSPPRTPLLRRAAVLLVTGAVTCSVCLFYYLSLETTPASVAVVLLFQFTWIGIILESIAERRLPSRTSVTSVAILLTGTLLAGGVLGTAISLTTISVCAALLCAFCYAVFIFLSGRIEPQMHPVHRSFWIVTCALFVLLCVLSPGYLTNGTVVSGIWIYDAALGLFGACLPVLLGRDIKDLHRYCNDSQLFGTAGGSHHLSHRTARGRFLGLVDRSPVHLCGHCISASPIAG